MPRPRLTPRRAMVATALAAILANGIFQARRAMPCRVAALAGMARYHSTNYWLLPVKTPGRWPDYTAVIEHHRRLAEKYRWALAHPWCPVLPDPPEPEPLNKP